MRVVFKTSYNQDINIFKHRGYVFWYGLLLASLVLLPLFLGEFFLGEMAFIFIWSIAGMGLMMLVGYVGLPSLGHAAFMAMGAYAQTYFYHNGAPFLVSILLSVAICAAVGSLIAIPLKKLTGLYFAIASLVFAIIVEETVIHWKAVTGGFDGMAVDPITMLGFDLSAPWALYYICFACLMIVLYCTLNIFRSPAGRAFIAIRDSEISAESMGIRIARFKIMAFGISGGFTGLAGALYAHKVSFLAPEAFNYLLSLQLLMMIVVGGLGTVHGAVYGAVFIGLLPQVIGFAKDYLPVSIGEFPGLEPALFGMILALFIIFEPQGMYGRWIKMKTYLEMFPHYRKATFKKQKSYLKTERVQ